MKLGTPGFVGARLKEAREARGLSAPALAQILGISRAAISQYENEQTSPGPDVLQRLSVVLNQPPDFFLKRRERRERGVFFRSKAPTTAAARVRASVLVDWLADIAVELRKNLQFPPVRFPTFELPDPSRLDLTAIEEAATQTRRYWGLGDGPISNIVWLLENNGAIVSRVEIEEAHMDSFSRCDPDDVCPLILLNADKSSAVRSRFDAAHELAHCVLHRNLPKEYWSTDAKVNMREKQAHSFASAFLLPRNTFGEDVLVPSLESFLALKRKWSVSVAAMLMRAEDIGLVREEHAMRLWSNLGRRGWRVREPFDDALPPESPRLLPKAVQVLAEHNPQGPLDLVRSVSLSPNDVADLTMLPIETFLEPEDSKLIQFRPKMY